MFFKIGALKNLEISGPLFNKVAGLNDCNFIKMRPQHCKLQVCLSMCDLLMDTRHYRVKKANDEDIPL